jgi:hypothetical protein
LIIEEITNQLNLFYATAEIKYEQGEVDDMANYALYGMPVAALTSARDATDSRFSSMFMSP